MKLELVSFKGCPYAQRCMILMKENGIDAEITFIDLDNPPAWFKEISPLGQVPLIKADDKVIFESMVIMELLDDLSPSGSRYPADPVERAEQKAWIAFGGNLMSNLFMVALGAKNKSEFEENVLKMKEHLKKLNKVVKGPFFGGEQFSMIDAAYAPFFARLDILNSRSNLKVLPGLKNIQQWRRSLSEHPAVIEGTPEGLEESYKNHIRHKKGYGATHFRLK